MFKCPQDGPEPALFTLGVNDFPSHWTFGKRHPQGADFGRVVYFVIRDSPLRSPVRRAVLGFLWPSFDPDGFEDTAYVNDLIGRAVGI